MGCSEARYDTDRHLQHASTTKSSTWAWQLIPHEGGHTRLSSRLRQRYRWRTPGPALLTVVLLEFGDFPTMRTVLEAIKARAAQGRRPKP